MEEITEKINLQDISLDLLKIYVSDDLDRENLKEPFFPIPSHVTATNGYEGVLLWAQHVKNEGIEYKNNPAIEGFFRAVPFNPASGEPIEKNCSFILQKDVLVDALSGAPLTEDTDEVQVTCTGCSGTGEEECDMGHIHACSQCDGHTYYLEDKPNGKMVVDTCKIISICDIPFGVKRLQNLLRTMEVSKENFCTLILSNPTGCNFFQFTDFIVYVMPMIPSEENKENIFYEIK